MIRHPGSGPGSGAQPEKKQISLIFPKNPKKAVTNPRIYTTSIMTRLLKGVIVGVRKNRTAGSERKGNAADTYIQFTQYISPE